MNQTVGIITVYIILIALLSAFLWGPKYLGREKSSAMRAKPTGLREHYGPPPGMNRAISPQELPDDRGWPGFDKVYEGSSASSISHMIERSA